MRELQQRFNNGRQPGEKKIYISRQKAKYRKVVNEEKLCKMLEEHGFEIICGENFSLAQQADIFSSAGTLLGLHGAGLANCIFMHPGSNVIEIRRKENGPHNVGYWHLADSLDQRYYYFNGTPDSDKPLVGQGCNLTVSLNEFEQSVLTKI
jgi:capsular polysaccharide biosynthesis protein